MQRCDAVLQITFRGGRTTAVAGAVALGRVATISAANENEYYPIPELSLVADPPFSFTLLDKSIKQYMSNNLPNMFSFVTLN